MMNMAYMTTRRTDKEVLKILQETIAKDELISIQTIASALDCHPLTVTRSIKRLEALRRIDVNRSRRVNRYRMCK